MKMRIIDIKNFFYNAHHDLQNKPIVCSILRTYIDTSYRILEADTECSPVFYIHIFVAKKEALEADLIVWMNIAPIDDVEQVLYLSIDNMLIDEEIEEIVFESIVGGYCFVVRHIFML